MANPTPHRAVPGVTATLRTDTLADSVLILLSLTAVQRVIGFCRAILFCRWLDAEQLGRWDMALSFLMLAAPLAVLALPGAFGRYVERFRQQGQLRTFLRRTTAACAVLAAVALVVILLGRQWFSRLIFGADEGSEMVVLLAASLATVIAYNFLIELFTALRNVRLVSVMQLANSLIFAVLGICLLLFWQRSAAGVVIAYGGACLVAAVGASWWLWRCWRASPPAERPVAHRTLWLKIAPFAGWVLLAAVLANVFEIVDRYMIIHFSTMSADEALRQVGNYHSSRVVPMLFVSIAAMLGTTITPHLSRDWEAGRRDRVVVRLRLFLKLFGLGLTAAAVAVLLAAPLLFGVAFKGKFAGGLAVLPWTLIYCSWFGLAMIATNYLWCAEKARLASLALLAGLVANVGLNLLLLPRLGLLGAVLATTAANLIALVLICTFTHVLGFRTDRGLWIILMLPLCVCLGPWPALLVLVVVALEVFCSDMLFSTEEKREIASGLGEYVRRFRKPQSTQPALH